MVKRIFTFAILFALSFAALAQSPSHSPLASGSWFKMNVSSDGIYQLTTQILPQLNGVPISHIALYGSSGGAIAQSAVANDTRCLQPCPLLVEDNNNNSIFDDSDRILFFAESCNIWRYVPNDLRWEFQPHPYATSHSYYLTISAPVASSLSISSLQPTLEEPVTSFIAVDVINNDLTSMFQTGQIWVGERFSSTLVSRNFTLSLPSPPVDDVVSLRYAFATDASNTASFQIAMDGQKHSQSIAYGTVYRSFIDQMQHHGSQLPFTVTFNPPSATSNGYLDFIEVNAKVPLVFSSGQQLVRYVGNGDSTSAATFLLSTLVPNLSVWDVTPGYAPCQLPVSSLSGRSCFVASCFGPRQFILFDGTQCLSPTNIVPLANQDIAGQRPPDMLIITKSELLPQAERLASLHRAEDNLDVLVFTDEQVFNEFSSGQPDPMAFRNLAAFYHNADPSTMRYLLLFGNASYDPRQLLNDSPKCLVTFESVYSFDENGTSYCSDDILGRIVIDSRIDVGVGRLPATTLAEATAMVDKIEAYIHRDDLSLNLCGDWRNVVALLADDADPSCPGDTLFVHSSEHLANNIKASYPNLNIDRIYADAYPQQSGAIGSYYPDVNNALKKRMDYGCLLLNYIGHGSTQYIGTERYMESTDIANYSNVNRLTCFITSTCSFGRYDLANEPCGALQFILAPAAGVAVISAARPIAHIERFNTDLCMQALNPDNALGDALRIAKNNFLGASPCIALLGDPALHLSLPRFNAKVTAINNRPVVDGLNDSAMVLTQVTVEGEVQDYDGHLVTDFNGTLFPIVYDRETTAKTLANDNEGSQVSFKQQKSMLYKGRDTVVNGRFSYRFIVPRDVAFDYGRGKISHYANDDSYDAAGSYQNIFFGGFDTSADINACRPSIRLFLNDTNFRSGASTNPYPTVLALLSDSVGINAVGSGLGHDITVTLDNNPNATIVLNDFFTPDYNDPRSGSLSYTLDYLAPGYHSLTLKAWNIYNYSNSSSISFFVDSSASLSVTQFFSLPNPAHEQTSIRIEHNGATPIKDALVSIYDVHGQLVFQHRISSNNPAAFQLPPLLWNFTNQAGAKLQPGLFFAHLLLTTSDGNTITKTTKILHL